MAARAAADRQRDRRLRSLCCANSTASPWRWQLHSPLRTVPPRRARWWRRRSGGRPRRSYSTTDKSRCTQRMEEIMVVAHTDEQIDDISVPLIRRISRKLCKNESQGRVRASWCLRSRRKSRKCFCRTRKSTSKNSGRRGPSGYVL